MPESFMFLVGTLEERKWMKESACAGLDPALFHPEEDAPDYDAIEAEAKAICASCIVADDCLSWALTRREPLGIWGGKTPRERRRLRKKKAS